MLPELAALREDLTALTKQSPSRDFGLCRTCGCPRLKAAEIKPPFPAEGPWLVIGCGGHSGWAMTNLSWRSGVG